ncbi:MAG: hypothetical protein H0W16_04145, partial [Actinobacteria bacterium]|nr:hypothetical protein [Actinomycetota bacterium]
MRLTTDLFAYAAERIPSWNTISISGYHIREAGSTAVQELAFTLANGIAYAQAAVDAGLSTAFHLPTLYGYDSDHEMARGEVGKCGVAVDSLRDMEVLFDGIDLGKVTTSMTINSTAPIA